MAYALISNGVVTAMSTIPQPGIPGFVQVADNDSRLLTFLATPLPMVAASLVAPKLAAGIALTSTGAPSLNATYALDPISTGQIFQIGLYAAQFSTFPSGASTQPYPDITGAQHTFTVTQFVAFLHAVAQLTSALQTQASIAANSGTPSWPAQTATIA